jgi:hypothetical protein
MLEVYPPDLRDFVNQKIAEGAFGSPDEFAVEAAELYRELDNRHRVLRDVVAEGAKALDEGAYTEISGAESLELFFEQIRSRGRQVLRDSAGA